MRIYEVIWKERFVEKIESTHRVTGKARFRRAEKGRVKGENLYVAYGQTETGRYVVVFFIYKKRRNAALPISARDMTKSERRFYEQKR